MYLVKTPFWLLLVSPDFVWHKDRSKRCIYLTFDDGPIPVVTPFVLDTLKKFNAKATFFCIGDNIDKHPDIFNRLHSEGHAIGNHTYNHLKGWSTEDETYIENFNKCQTLTQTNLFRPPYGRIKGSQSRELKAQSSKPDIVMWDVLSGDFDEKLKPQNCLDNVIWNTENGSIIVFHDSLKAQPRLEFVLPRALQFWKEKGFEFGIL
jgi:peptidoglycan/xylan/chitin deacetylase (PgdA/CDA1 family)